jgi:hypothetical protein
MTTTGSRNVGASRRAPGPSLAGRDPEPKSLSSRNEGAPISADSGALPRRVRAGAADADSSNWLRVLGHVKSVRSPRIMPARHHRQPAPPHPHRYVSLRSPRPSLPYHASSLGSKTARSPRAPTAALAARRTPRMAGSASSHRSSSHQPSRGGECPVQAPKGTSSLPHQPLITPGRGGFCGNVWIQPWYSWPATSTVTGRREVVWPVPSEP